MPLKPKDLKLQARPREHRQRTVARLIAWNGAWLDSGLDHHGLSPCLPFVDPASPSEITIATSRKRGAYYPDDEREDE